jgi:putative SOS response-associated peptidase YedK
VCGRFTLRRPELVQEHFELAQAPELAARFNAAPGQSIATIDRHSDGSARALRMRNWGLVPPWAESPTIGSRMINARSETLHERPAFRSAYQRHRCLIPADGFYEWDAQVKPPQPHWIRKRDESLFAFAGIFEHWRDAAGSGFDSCAIVTTSAQGALRELHERAPVILAPGDYELWLDPRLRASDELAALLAPGLSPELLFSPVARALNDVRVDDPSCLAPAPREARQASLF